jgi:hypothetical protein
VTACEPSCHFARCPVKTGSLPLHDAVQTEGDGVLVIECGANPLIAALLAQFANLAKRRSHV